MIISNFLRGTAKCKIDAPNPPGIINALKDVFPILKLEKTGDFTYELTTYLVYADQLCAQAAQDGAKTEIILRKGVPYFFSKYKKRAGIFLGLAFFVTANSNISSINIKTPISFYFVLLYCFYIF